MKVHRCVLIKGIKQGCAGLKIGGIEIKTAKRSKSEPCIISRTHIGSFDNEVAYHPENMYDLISCILSNSSRFSEYSVPPDIIRKMVPTPGRFNLPAFNCGEEDESAFIYLDWVSENTDSMCEVAENLIDAMRLHRLSCVGVGLMIEESSDGLGLNDLYQSHTSVNVASNMGLPLELSTDDCEKISSLFAKLKRIKTEPDDEKNGLIIRLLNLYRLSFSAPDYNTAFLIQAIIWETFLHVFPLENNVPAEGLYDYCSSRDNRGRHHAIKSKAVRTIIPMVLMNGEHDFNRLKDVMYYLYDQRSKYAHGDTGLELKSFIEAFEISRCIIRKLIEYEGTIKEMVRSMDNVKINNGKISPRGAWFVTDVEVVQYFKLPSIPRKKHSDRKHNHKKSNANRTD